MATAARSGAAAIAIAASVVAACGGPESPPREVETTRILANWATTDLNGSWVVRSEAEWASVWALLTAPTAPPTARPAVAFATRMLVGLTQGTGPNGCHGLRIVRVLEAEREIRVEFVRALPSGLQICTQALVPLTDFVEIGRTDKAVVFAPVDQ